MHHVVANSAYVDYWNDEAIERTKPYWIESADDDRLRDYLYKQTNLARCFEAGLAYVSGRVGGLHGTVLDLAAGVCWSSAIVSRQPGVETVHAIDYSEHRLMKVAPLVFEQLNAAQAKIQRHCQPLMPLPLEDCSADLAIFCQALYMSSGPIAMLREVHRVLRPGGVVLICCESVSDPRFGRIGLQRLTALRHTSLRCWKQLLNGRQPDASGRYQYSERDYAAFLIRAGFSFEVQRLPYPLFEDLRWPCANYVGTIRAKV